MQKLIITAILEQPPKQKKCGQIVERTTMFGQAFQRVEDQGKLFGTIHLQVK